MISCLASIKLTVTFAVGFHGVFKLHSQFRFMIFNNSVIRFFTKNEKSRIFLFNNVVISHPPVTDGRTDEWSACLSIFRSITHITLITVTKSRLWQWVPRMGLRVVLESVHSGLEYKYMGQEASQVVSKIIGGIF